MEILNNDYRDMVASLQKEGVEFMLVGGYALSLERIREKRNG